jgi:hypothetical protein
MTTNHQRFTEHLEASTAAVWIAAKWLHSKGLTVTVNRTEVAPDAGQWREYVDEGDIEVTGKTGKRYRVEVKGLGVNFSGPEDWPFDSEFIVCGKNSHERAEPKPYAYLILSKDLLSMAVVYTDTERFWREKVKQDHRYEKLQQAFLLCPLEFITWITF